MQVDYKDAEAIAAMEYGRLDGAWFYAAYRALKQDLIEHGESSVDIAQRAIDKMMGKVK